MNKKRNLLILIILFLVVVILYRINNFNSINGKSIIKEKTYKGLNYTDTLTIKKNNDVSNDVYNKISIKKLDNFTLTYTFPYNEIKEGNDTEYYKRYTLNSDLDKNEGLKTTYSFGSVPNYSRWFSKEETSYDYNIGTYKYLDSLKRQNINNSLDLINYVKKHYNDNNSVFYIKESLQDNYKLFKLASLIIPENVKSLTKVDGDFNGLIFNLDNVREVHLYGKKNEYVFVFSNLKYFTDDKIANLLGSFKYTE